MRLSNLEVKKTFYKLEKDQALLSFRLRGVSLYYILRFPLETRLRAGTFTEEKGIKKNNLIKRVITKVRSKLEPVNNVDDGKYEFDSEDSLVKSPFLFVGTCAFVNEEGSNPDMYDIIKYYHQRSVPINFIQPKLKRTPFPQKSRYYDTFVPIEDSQDKLTDKEKETVEAFIDLVEKKFNIDLKSKMLSYLITIQEIFSKAKKLEKYIKKVEASYVYARSVYTEPWVPIACDKTNTKLIEVQHGVVAEDTIYYQSSLGQEGLNKKHVLMPSYILTIGEEWRKILINQHSYFTSENVFNVGLKEYSPQETSKNKNSKRILFLLQSRRLEGLFSISGFITEFIDRYKDDIINSDIDVVIRPHPNDKEEADIFLKKFRKYVKVEDSHQETSLNSIQKSDIIVGATSMCLYEALAYGKKAVSFSWFSAMTSSVHNIDFIDTPRDLIDLVKLNSDIKETVPFLSEFNEKTLNYFYDKAITDKLDNN